MSFWNRWVVTGQLVTKSPLHLGTGELENHVAVVYRDHSGRPMAPGTAIKSWVRRAVERVSGASDADRLLGSLDAGGHRVACEDACVNGTVGTLVMASVAIDRHTGTALDKHLFQVEYVPAGTTFDVTISAIDLADTEDEERRLVALLIAALAHASEDPDLTIGAEASSGWGEVSWRLTQISRFTSASLTAWSAMPESTRPCGFGAAQPVDPVIADELQTTATAMRQTFSLPSRLVFELELEVESLLVGDGTSTTGPTQLRGAQGEPLLPSRSVRGVLRAQAERVLRTIVQRDNAACQPASPCSTAVGAVAAGEPRACLVCEVMGSTGWRSPLRVSWPTVMSAGQSAPQTRLAIDRFSHAIPNDERPDVADEQRFSGRTYAVAPVRHPIFGVRLSLDVDRLASIGRWSNTHSEAIGLLAFVLRDLCEGDIEVGGLSGVGFGEVTVRAARITRWPSVAHQPIAMVSWPDPLLDSLPAEGDPLDGFLTRSMEGVASCLGS